MSDLNTTSTSLTRKAQAQFNRIAEDGGFIGTDRADALWMLLDQAVEHIGDLQTELTRLKRDLAKVATVVHRMSH